MSAKTFEEWADGRFDLSELDQEMRRLAHQAWEKSRIALLADRPDVAGLVERIGNVVFADEHCTDDALKRETITALESLAAQAAERGAALLEDQDVAGLVARVNLRRGTDQMRKLRGERPQDDPWPWIHETELLAALESLAAQVAERDAEIAKLKGHAEAMAAFIEECDENALIYVPECYAEFRADYPEAT